MNKYIESNSKKFLIMLLLICLVFFILIIKAFEYIPMTDKDAIVSRNNIENLNKPAEENAEEQQNNQNEQTEKPTLDVKLTPDFVDKQKNEVQTDATKTTEPLENITDLPEDTIATNNSEETKSIELTPEEKADKILLAAQKYKKDKQYVKALEEYQKIPTITNDTTTIARSYEEIATIYAIVKRYGTALSYAQKAYNMSPSSSREMLLARLYYKTGDIDKATKRINNVLQRDFSSDR